jgi:hypothetical protein
MPRLVGEKGPELFTPESNGHTTPNANTMLGAGGIPRGTGATSLTINGGIHLHGIGSDVSPRPRSTSAAASSPRSPPTSSRAARVAASAWRSGREPADARHADLTQSAFTPFAYPARALIVPLLAADPGDAGGNAVLQSGALTLRQATVTWTALTTTDKDTALGYFEGSRRWRTSTSSPTRPRCGSRVRGRRTSARTTGRARATLIEQSADVRTITPELTAILRSRFQAAGDGYSGRIEVDTPTEPEARQSSTSSRSTSAGWTRRSTATTTRTRASSVRGRTSSSSPSR